MKTYHILIKRNNNYTVFTVSASNDTEAVLLAQQQGEVVYDNNKKPVLTVIDTSDAEIDYKEQMLNYYPEVIKKIREFQALIDTQSVEITDIHRELTKALENANIVDANEDRLSAWEKYLGIIPTTQGDEEYEDWLSNRRSNILAKLYRPEKLNTKSIEEIVAIFTRQTDNKFASAISYFDGSTIHVLISPPKGNLQYKFESVEQELRARIPAHLNLNVVRNYYSWENVNSNYATWGDVNTKFVNWNEVLFELPTLNK